MVPFLSSAGLLLYWPKSHTSVCAAYTVALYLSHYKFAEFGCSHTCVLQASHPWLPRAEDSTLLYYTGCPEQRCLGLAVGLGLRKLIRILSLSYFSGPFYGWGHGWTRFGDYTHAVFKGYTLCLCLRVIPLWTRYRGIEPESATYWATALNIPWTLALYYSFSEINEA